MQSFKVGNLNGHDLTFYQCENMEEAKEQGLPSGVHFFWKYQNRRIDSPGEIVSMVMRNAQNGTLDVAQALTGQNIQAYYKKLVDSQRKTTMEHLRKTREQFVKQGNMPEQVMKESLKNLDETIAFYDKEAPFPGIDGVFRPTRAQAEVLLHGKDNLNKTMTKEEQKEVFKE